MKMIRKQRMKKNIKAAKTSVFRNSEVSLSSWVAFWEFQCRFDPGFDQGFEPAFPWVGSNVLTQLIVITSSVCIIRVLIMLQMCRRVITSTAMILPFDAVRKAKYQRCTMKTSLHRRWWIERWAAGNKFVRSLPPAPLWFGDSSATRHKAVINSHRYQSSVRGEKKDPSKHPWVT